MAWEDDYQLCSAIANEQRRYYLGCSSFLCRVSHISRGATLPYQGIKKVVVKVRASLLTA
jgi:hypothetical protein